MGQAQGGPETTELNPIDRLSDRLDSVRVVHNMAVIGALVEMESRSEKKKVLNKRLDDARINIAENRTSLTEDQGPEGSIEVIEALIVDLDGVITKLSDVASNSKANYVISMVSAFEVFLGELLATAFRTCPRCMMNSSSTMNDEMLVKAIVDDNVLDALVSARVRKVMSDNLLKCGNTIGSILGADTSRVEELKELMQVRNCLVHNDGKPSPELARDFPNYGTASKIALNDDWLSSHHKLIFIIANDIWTSVWLKLGSGTAPHIPELKK